MVAYASFVNLLYSEHLILRLFVEQEPCLNLDFNYFGLLKKCNILFDNTKTVRSLTSMRWWIHLFIFQTLTPAMVLVGFLDISLSFAKFSKNKNFVSMIMDYSNVHHMLDSLTCFSQYNIHIIFLSCIYWPRLIRMIDSAILVHLDTASRCSEAFA